MCTYSIKREREKKKNTWHDHKKSWPNGKPTPVIDIIHCVEETMEDSKKLTELLTESLPV